MANKENMKDKESNTAFYAKNGVRIGLIAILYISFAAASYHFIEGWGWLDSYYFVVVTISTVGYGDIAPKTNFGKLFTIFFIIIGIAIFSAAITDIARRARQRREKKLSGGIKGK